MRLPIADGVTTRRHTMALLRRHRAAIAVVVVLQGLAALASLALPFVLGLIVDAVARGTTMEELSRFGVFMIGAVVLEALLTFFAHSRALIMGEKMFAELREEFLHNISHLPLSAVERAGTGDLLGRTTNDIDRVQWVLRFGIPDLIVSVTVSVLTLGAGFLVSWQTAFGLLAGVPLIYLAARRYLRVAKPAYIRNASAYAELNGVVSENIEHAGTVDALWLGRARRRRSDAVMAETWDTEVVTMWMRVRLFLVLDFAFIFPIAVILLWGGWLVSQDVVTAGQVTTIALYALQVRRPLIELVFWLDELQVAAASLNRIFGIALVEPDRTATGQTPANDRLQARDVRYAYVEGHDVLHGIDLDLVPGERLAIVGPSGAGKSTFGRMLAGIHPPTGGQVTVGGVRLVDLTEDELRRQVVLVTQEHHVFVGTIAENLQLADDDADEQHMRAALEAVDALPWVSKLPEGLATKVGSGGMELTPAQAQQIALARLVLLNPHTLVLDEATSLLDPRAARHLERSLLSVLSGRTVVAIAHRLHTAHDADRVAVIDEGRIQELGTHDELVAAGGAYAKLWESWQQE